MFRNSFFAALLGVGALLLSPGESMAQRRGGGSWGGRGGNWGGRSGYYGGRGWNGGGLYLGLGYGGWWPGSYGYGDSYYSTPYYYGYSSPYYSDYTASQPIYTTDVTGEEQEEPAIASNAATILVRVPGNAQVWFDDSLTQQTGMQRTFVSPQIQPNRVFTYHIRAHWRNRDGQEMNETRVAHVQAGKVTSVDFFAPNTSTLGTETTPLPIDKGKPLPQPKPQKP